MSVGYAGTEACAVFPEAHNGLSALVAQTAKVERNGSTWQLDGIWISSFTDSATRGLPDVEIVGNGERIDTLQEVCAVTTKPILIDGDTGGMAEQFAYCARALGRVGASGVVIEDKRVPKRNSLDEHNATSYHETMGMVLASRGFDII
jgi:phosphoenolpyruvate phosphomutase